MNYEELAGFMRHLNDRDLSGPSSIVSDKCLGLIEASGEFFPEAK